MRIVKLTSVPYRIVCNKNVGAFIGTRGGKRVAIHFNKGAHYAAARKSDGGVIIFNSAMSTMFSDMSNLKKHFDMHGPYLNWETVAENHNTLCGKRTKILI